jgi:hypothetical protein
VAGITLFDQTGEQLWSLHHARCNEVFAGSCNLQIIPAEKKTHKQAISRVMAGKYPGMAIAKRNRKARMCFNQNQVVNRK